LHFENCHNWSRDCRLVPNLNLCTTFHQNCWFSLRYGDFRFSRWRISAVLNFRGPTMGSLKSPCRSSTETIALNCLVFEKIAYLAFWRQTDKQMDSRDALWRCRSISNIISRSHRYLTLNISETATDAAIVAMECE